MIILVLGLFIHFPSIEAPEILEIPGLGIAFLFLVGGYIAGSILQEVSRRVDEYICGLDNNFEPFERLQVFTNRMDRVEGGGKPEYDYDEQFWKGSQSFFKNKDYSEIDSNQLLGHRELFELTQSHLLNNSVGQMYRFQILYHFFRSVYILLSFTAIFYFLSFVLLLMNNASVELAIPYLALSIIFLFAGVVGYNQRKFFETRMAEVMIVDFTSNVLSGEA